MWGANPNTWNFSSREEFCCEGIESMGVNEHVQVIIGGDQ